MNAVRLLVAFGIALAAAPLVAAQEKQEGPAQPPKNTGQGMTQFVSGNETLNSGDEVTLTRKGGEKVKGTFVWMDPQAKRLYIRPQAGAAPVAVAAADIDTMKRETPAANVPDKGGVKPAINTGDQQPRSGSEIHALEILNGTTRSVHHFGGTLSRAERERLGEIDRAAADVADKRLMVQSLSRSIQNPGNDTGATVVQTAPAAPATLPYWAYPFYDYYAPGGYYTPYYYPSYGPYAGPLYGAGYGAAHGPGLGGMYAPAAMPSTVVVQTSGGGGASRADLMKSLSEAQTALTRAEKSYAAVQNNAVYGAGGNIVAVRLPE